ncbi:MAG TPA: transposase [Ktedonobacteraceae bacterium]|nr:transposase [Ktedonobacteraceae bacterium]
MWVDEAGFSLLPMVVRTYAPRGHTPSLSVPLTSDHLAVMGALTAEGKMVMHIQDHAYKGPDVVRFLRLLLRKLPGPLLVIWDSSPIHRCNAVKDFLFFGGAKRLHLECLPAYAPELNPQEGVWNLLKRRELKNVCMRDLGHLEAELVKAKERLRHRTAVLSQCIAHAGLRL